jgi:hypothetical protein
MSFLKQGFSDFVLYTLYLQGKECRHIEIWRTIGPDRYKSSRSDDVFGISVRKSGKKLLSTSVRSQFSLCWSVKQCL